MRKKYVIGVDYGSDSVRCVIADTETGSQLSQGVACYPRWNAGLYQHPNERIFRQHPRDYLEGLELCVKEALSAVSEDVRAGIVGIGIDTTGSTPAPVNREGIPLALTEPFQENENAMFFLWKDHAAASEAEEINRIFESGTDTCYTKYQGKYSSEWFWAKILHAVRTEPALREEAYMWIEHCDWMVSLLCGRTQPEQFYHSACAAGHKALWHSEWNGLPSQECLKQIDPYLAQIAERYGNPPEPASVKAGALTKEWAERLGLPEGITVSGSSFDAHAGAVGAGIRHRTLVCTLGTSAVDMLVEKPDFLSDKDISSYCGQAENSILPGYTGIETGQAAFGDVFAWFKRLLMWPIQQAGDRLPAGTAEYLEKRMLPLLDQAASCLPWAPFPVVLDWFNGRRYPGTNDFQKAVFTQLSLGISAPCLYRSLIFGTLCGLKRIVQGFENAGLQIDSVIAVGGISRKADYLMQMMADLLGKTVAVSDADQTCALGAAVYAAAASGVYADMADALAHMSAKCSKHYEPDQENGVRYERYYQEYRRLAEIAERESI